MKFRMSDLRPRREEGSGAARLLADVRARIAAARAELALPEALRLSEWQRAAVSAMLRRLVENVEDELRAAVAAGMADAVRASLTAARVPIAAPILARLGSFPDAELIALALRRAEEHRLAREAQSEEKLLGELVADADEGIAAEAMAVLIALSARLDAFQEPAIGRNDLPAELHHQLAWSVAAALRRYLVEQHDVAEQEADSALSTAVAALLTRHDEGASFDALCLRLARRLAEAGRLDDDMLVRMLDEGGLPLFLAALAIRTGIDSGSAWQLITEAPSMLLHGAGVRRDAAGAILLRLAHGREEAALDRLERFDAAEPDEAGQRLGLWRVDPAYREAIAALQVSG